MSITIISYFVCQNCNFAPVPVVNQTEGYGWPKQIMGGDGSVIWRVLPWLLALAVAVGAPVAAGPGPDPDLTPSGAVALPGPGKEAAITLRGRLITVAGPEGAHYRLNEYVIVAKDPDLDLARFAERDVEVHGVLSDAPSIFMMPVLIALEVQFATPTMPEVPPIHPAPPQPAPEPGPADPPQLPRLPVQPLPEPDPEPAPVPVMPPQFPQPEAPGKPDLQPVLPVLPGDAVSPAPVAPPGLPEKRLHPVPLFGSSRLVLFGTLATTGPGLFAIDGAAVSGPAADLAAAAGQRVAAVVTAGTTVPGGAPDGPTVWQVERLIGLEADLDTLLGAPTGGLYAEPAAPLRVLASGRPVLIDSPPIMGNGRILLPIRTVTEALGAEVAWHAATRTVTVQLGGQTVDLTVGSNQVAVQTEAGVAATVLAVDVAPVICTGRLLVPVRVLSEGLGLRVEWDAATHTVRIG